MSEGQIDVVAAQQNVIADRDTIELKLTFALVVIALHHVIGGRAKRLGSGQTQAARGVGLFGFILFACAACAAVLGVAKSLP